MKKLLLILAVLLLFGFAGGCGANDAASPLQSKQTQLSSSQTEEAITTPSVDPRWVTFEPWANYEDCIPAMAMDMSNPQTFVKLNEEAPICVVATVKDIEIIVLDTQRQTCNDNPLQDTKVKYTVEIEQSVVGDLIAGETMYVFRNGWKFGDINIYHEYFPPLDYDKKYLISIRKVSDGQGESYRFGSPFVAYPEIIDGKLYPGEHTRLFYEGDLLEDVIPEIQAAAFSIMPINIPIEQSTDMLLQWLNSYADGFAPVRDLTSEELQEFYDFERQAFVIAVVGKQLQNGYKVVWIKTSELDRDQQSEFFDALNATAQAMADKEGIHAKVSCRPFDSLITLIGANEDNASVHDQFSRMQSREEYVQKIRFLPWETFENNLPKITLAIPKRYDSISELAQDSDFIVLATLRDIRVTPRGGGSELMFTTIEYILELEQNIKNQYDYYPGSRIGLEQEGYAHNGYNIYRPEAPPLEYGKTYLIFANGITLGTPLESYPLVIDGVLYPHENSELFHEGMLLEDVLALIE